MIIVMVIVMIIIMISPLVVCLHHQQMYQFSIHSAKFWAFVLSILFWKNVRINHLLKELTHSEPQDITAA